MRIRFELTPASAVWLPWSHQYALSSAIYATIAYASPGFSTFLHDKGFVAEGKQFRLFTFSSLMGKVLERTNYGLLMQAPINLLCSSPIPEFVRAVAEGSLQKGSLRVGDVELPVARVETLPDPEFTERMLFRPLSPITVSTGRVDDDGKMRATYLTPDTPDFFIHLAENLAHKFQALTGKPNEDSVMFNPFGETTPDGKRLSKLIDIKGIKVKGWLVPVEGEGNPELLRLVYEAGLGEKNSVGFGMVEAINQNRKEES